MLSAASIHLRRRLSHPSLASFGLAFSLAGTFVSDAGADIDLTGRWRSVPGTPYAEIVQSGSNVTVTWDSQTLSGTFDQTQLSATIPMSRYLNMRVYGGGTTLDGTFGVNGSASTTHVRFTRCECYDGDEASGDGCDAECLVEPCHTCTPEPSVCTPSPDAAPCDDRNDCTTGETCSAGTCAAGSPVEPCVNLTGDWQVLREAPDSVVTSRAESIVTYTQRNGLVTSAGEIGNVDPVTGTLDLTSQTGSIFCGSSTDEGMAALNNLEFELSGFQEVSSIARCLEFAETTVGRRCDAVRGCDLVDCSGVDDGTPCADTDPCTIFESCRAGVCAGVPKCPACETCNEVGGCDTGPIANCVASTDSDSSKLQIVGRQIGFTWSRGHAFDATLYDPSGPTDFTLCMFGSDDTVLYKNGLSSLDECAKEPCWKQNAGSYSYRNDDEMSPVTSLKLKSGIEGRSRVQMKMKGPLVDNSGETGLEIPVAPLALPIRIQLQSDTGACVEAEFDSAGTKQNEDGTFKATGGALP